MFPPPSFFQRGTPRSWFDVAGLEGRVGWVAARAGDRGVTLAYSIKTNPARSVLMTMAAAGLAGSAISAAEIGAAVRAGFDIGDLVLAGPAKAWPSGQIPAGLLVLVDETLAGFAAHADPAANHRHHCLRVRFPGSGSRFGFGAVAPEELVRLASSLTDAHRQGVSVGLALHKSRVTVLDLAEWMHSVLNLLDSVVAADSKCAEAIDCMDVGGGFDQAALDEILAGSLGAALIAGIRARLPRCQRIVLEPGRSLVEQFGALVVRVLMVNPVEDVTSDGCMTELPWPSPNRPVYVSDGPRWRLLSPGPGIIYGRSTAETDIMARGLYVGELSPGDLLLFGNAGAYDMSMRNRFASGLLAEDEWTG